MGNLRVRMKISSTIIVLFLTLIGCNEQESIESLLLSDFKFESILGTTNKEPQNTYCLLGSGFFRTPRSSNSDSLISDWIQAHPNAVVVPVSSYGPTVVKDKDSKMIYCWLIDNEDTLNNYLIKNGCFPSGTMMRPKIWDEMETWEKELYEGTGEKPDVKVHVDQATYDKFIEQIKSAEIYAKEEKLGIWIDDTGE